MNERMRFVADWERSRYSRVELCERYGISRKTGYKWVDRYEREGPPGLQERVGRPIGARTGSPPSWQTRFALCGDSIRAGAQRRSCSGCAPRQPGWALPATSTAGDLLARHGLVRKRRRRRRYTHPGLVAPTTRQPNDLWTADFKGHFRTRDGVYCYPLTVADQHTRYLLGCRGLLSTQGQGVRPIFDRLFREYGLPAAIRTDNGVPFATTGIHGLSQLCPCRTSARDFSVSMCHPCSRSTLLPIFPVAQ